jgi:hypothetical protein
MRRFGYLRSESEGGPSSLLGGAMSPQVQISTNLLVVLRRLMKAGDHTTEDVVWRLVEQQGIPRCEPRRQYWVLNPNEGLDSRGGFLPNGLRLRMRYKRGAFFYAEVREGKIWMDGEAFDSPSAAASVVARQSGANRYNPHLDGWKYWDYEFPVGSETWYSVDTLRQ